ncbi:3D domain-containing protein [Candidatus Parcubacteria bacterium]|nr:3D domain-containing protein [Candidatus Parcubacteria bacterium]
MEALHKNHKRIISLKPAKRMIILLVLVFAFDFLLFPIPAMASEATEADINTGDEQIILDTNEDISEPANTNRLPANDNISVKWSGYYTMTAYNSEIGQTDDSPCITANGFNLCEHNIEDTIAANFLRFGAKVKIPDLFGNKVFIVRDRMNKKYSDRVDVWMVDKGEAKKFGIKMAKIEVLE